MSRNGLLILIGCFLFVGIIIAEVFFFNFEGENGMLYLVITAIIAAVAIILMCRDDSNDTDNPSEIEETLE